MNTYRISRPFQIDVQHQFHEGEIITPPDFLGRLRGLDLTDVADCFEPTEIYFFRKCLPVFAKIEELQEGDFTHTGPEPIKRLNTAMRDLLEANTLDDVPAFDAALETVEAILQEVDRGKEAAEKKATTKARKTKKAVQNRKAQKDFEDALSGRV